MLVVGRGQVGILLLNSCCSNAAVTADMDAACAFNTAAADTAVIEKKPHLLLLLALG